MKLQELKKEEMENINGGFWWLRIGWGLPFHHNYGPLEEPELIYS